MNQAMSKHGRHNLPTPTLANRPGEGVVVDVAIEQFIATDGSTVANVGINLGAAQVPDRKYSADACAVAQTHGTVKIIFGQERVGGKGWRSLVLVQMSAESAGRFLGTLNQPGHPLSDGNNPFAKFGSETLTTDVTEPEQAITLSANLAVVAMNDNEACLDFYQASPFSMGAAFKSKKLALDPVVRIDLRSSLFMAIIDGLRGLGIKPQELKVQGGAS
jgi:hypothetical protein